jgi:hypothetical protein
MRKKEQAITENNFLKSWQGKEQFSSCPDYFNKTTERNGMIELCVKNLSFYKQTVLECVTITM